MKIEKKTEKQGKKKITGIPVPGVPAALTRDGYGFETDRVRFLKILPVVPVPVSPEYPPYPYPSYPLPETGLPVPVPSHPLANHYL